ncbi:hypothetical protein [Colwellia sp. C1TZA3]|uniref:hypothetical protein n=1 Tax=Colwellia sp. C1TZA3 TaxID=2508879 RepID=UPI0011B9B4C4|nr:hypothetical protein [Colwellia sp. C1TZA3]TWX65332.1 hypothetical protein ESZ39_15345 [Colwellia sp. C1TZA3]
MTTESPIVDICYLEAWLESFVCDCKPLANKQSLAKICIAINAIIQHEDFNQLADRHCSYHKMKNYWQWRYQIA